LQLGVELLRDLRSCDELRAGELAATTPRPESLEADGAQLASDAERTEPGTGRLRPSQRGPAQGGACGSIGAPPSRRGAASRTSLCDESKGGGARRASGGARGAGALHRRGRGSPSDRGGRVPWGIAGASSQDKGEEVSLNEPRCQAMRRPAACSAPTLGDSPLSDGPRPARPCDAGRGGTLGIPAGCNWFLKEEVATLQKELAALVLDMGESDDNRSDAESCCSVITLPAPAADDPPGSDREDLAGCGASSVGCESLFDATEDEMLLAPAWPWPPEASLAELIVESGSEAQVGAGLVLAEAARINALTSKNPCTRALIAHLSDASTADPAVGDLAADCEPADGDDSRSIASTVAFDCVGYTHQAESEIATTLSDEKVISAVMMALPLSDWSAVARICKSVAVRVTTNAAPVDSPCSARLARPCDAGPRSADVAQSRTSRARGAFATSEIRDQLGRRPRDRPGARIAAVRTTRLRARSRQSQCLTAHAISAARLAISRATARL
jgi:hypothetical protein